MIGSHLEASLQEIELARRRAATVVVVINSVWEGGGPSGAGPAEPQAGRGTAGSGDVRPAVTGLCQMAMVMGDVKAAVGEGDA